jgi:TorA maturation chaperone TorD
VDHSFEEDIEALQRRFFQAHIEPWAEKFFRDLSETPTADFYRAVGHFGLVFVEFEERYLSMRV